MTAANDGKGGRRGRGGEDRRVPEIIRGKAYLDPRYNPAFQEFFGSEDALVDFLNAVLRLEGGGKIRTLTFRLEEPLRFRVPARATSFFDIRATTGDGKAVDVEMQRADHHAFVERTLLYNAFLTVKAKTESAARLAASGADRTERAYRRYELPEIVSVWLCDFDLSGFPDEYHDEWNLYSRVTLGRLGPLPLTEKTRYIMIELPKFTKTREECRTDEDRWLYALRHAADGGLLPSSGNGAVDRALSRIRVDGAADGLVRRQVRNMDTRDEYECRLAERDLEIAKRDAEIATRNQRDRDRSAALLQNGVDPAVVARTFGLSAADLRELRRRRKAPLRRGRARP